MLRRLLAFVLVMFGTPSLADPEDDVALYIEHFIDQSYWDSAHRRGKGVSALLYRKSLSERGVAIVDRKAFINMIPDVAADEAVERLKWHAGQFIIESYGQRYLYEIAVFFRTPTGQKMLAIAKDQNLFKVLHRQSPKGGPIERWRDHLSPLDRARFNAFANSEAGQFFVTQTWAVRRSLHYLIGESSRWPEPPLNRPYIVDILKADGILKFPNRIIRQTLISELGASSP